MTNDERRASLSQSTDLHALIMALDDPATVYVALRRLEALGAGHRGLEVLVGHDDPRLGRLAARIDFVGAARVVAAYYERYDEFPFAAFTTIIQMATDTEAAAFLRWKSGLLRPLTSVFLLDSMSDVAHMNGVVLNETGDLLTVGVGSSIGDAEPELRRFGPDAILVGERLSGRNGLDAVEALHAMLPQARIVLISRQYDDRATCDAAWMAGASQVISAGPYSPRAYQRAIHDALGLPFI